MHFKRTLIPQTLQLRLATYRHNHWLFNRLIWYFFCIAFIVVICWFLLSLNESDRLCIPLNEASNVKSPFLARFKNQAIEDCYGSDSCSQCLVDHLYLAGMAELSKPKTLPCAHLKEFGEGDSKKWVRHLAQGPYQLCFDQPYRPTPGNCLVYSFGISNDWTFDDAMATYGCEVFSFDPSIPHREHRRPSGVHFYPFGLAHFNGIYVPPKKGAYVNLNPDGNWTMKTLKGIADFLVHKGRTIDVLKIDIEGGEVKTFAQALGEGFLQANVASILVEWHFHQYTYENTYDIDSLAEFVDTYNALLDETTGFKVYYADRRQAKGDFYTTDGLINTKLFIQEQNIENTETD